MASSPEAAQSDDSSPPSPPASSTPTLSPQASPPAHANSPPPPKDSDPSSPPPANSPEKSPPSSPPPPTTTTAHSPPLQPAPPGAPAAPVFSLAPPAGVTSQAPPSPVPPSPVLSPSRPNTSPSSSRSTPASEVAVIAGIVSGGVAILALLIVCQIFMKKKKKQRYYADRQFPPQVSGGDKYHHGSIKQNKTPPMDHIVKINPPAVAYGSSEFSLPGPAQTPISPNVSSYGTKSQFTYNELAAATGGFSAANLLGQGGFGFVHKGILPDGREVAVKSLKTGNGQGEPEFLAEVEIIGRVHHRHLVSLVGSCIASDKRMLVCEFVPNKTLEFHLHGKGQPVMDWASRLRIAMGSAKGLAYLHEDCHPRIIHRDIKAANILLDNSFEAMVADFGLAKLTSDNFTHVSTRVMGTFGYLAPEYAASGKLTEKSDVFSFGVMLLELITGRRPVDPTNKTMEESLVDWARPFLSKALEDGDYSKLVDPRLEDNYVPHEMARMIACAAAAIRHSARRRPRMTQIVRALDGDASLDLNEDEKGGQSPETYKPNVNREVYDTRAYNADMMKFRKMVISSQEGGSSSEYDGVTSEYGLNPSASSSDTREMT